MRPRIFEALTVSPFHRAGDRARGVHRQAIFAIVAIPGNDITRRLAEADFPTWIGVGLARAVAQAGISFQPAFSRGAN